MTRAENMNILDKRPDHAKQMQAELTKWQQSVVRSLNGEDYRQTEKTGPNPPL